MIGLARRPGRWTVTLERPEKANALTRAMLERLADLAEAAAVEPDLRVFVLTGAGARAFSAGGDLDEVRAGLDRDPVWARLSAAIAALPCLSIAALNGTLAGGAFGMALACDLRLAVAEARFFYPVLRLGLRPPPPDPGRLVALVGPARAKLLLLGGARWDAVEALAFGLVDRGVPAGRLEAAVEALAADALAGRAEVLRDIKAACGAG
jgi:enoyl-CoA hydratase/carnithine racemase